MKNREIIPELNDKIVGVKIGSLLCWELGLKKVVQEIKRLTNLPLIFDPQKGGNDIPYIIEKQVKMVYEAGIEYFISAPVGAGLISLKTFVTLCRIYGIVPIILCEMTHQESNYFLSEDSGRKIFQESLNLGVTHFVVPIRLTSSYRDIANEKIVLMSPGIDNLSFYADADYLIAGRILYNKFLLTPKSEERGMIC